MCIKVCAMGLAGKDTYLAETWNRLDMFIVIAGWVQLFFKYFENLHVHSGCSDILFDSMYSFVASLSCWGSECEIFMKQFNWKQIRDGPIFVWIYKSEQCSDFGWWVSSRKLDVHIFAGEIIHTHKNLMIFKGVQNFISTVEPRLQRLTDTQLRRTPHWNERFWLVPNIFTVKSCLKFVSPPPVPTPYWSSTPANELTPVGRTVKAGPMGVRWIEVLQYII